VRPSATKGEPTSPALRRLARLSSAKAAAEFFEIGFGFEELAGIAAKDGSSTVELSLGHCGEVERGDRTSPSP
jgi:hypothetical protein